MTFEEWFEKEGAFCDANHIVRAAWEDAWDQQQRVIDEMHLMFKDHVLVPKEPTEAMLERGLAYGGTRHSLDQAYAAMVQAAQDVRE